ncbi:angiotensin-converting enzyme-like protein, partial [Leptotrombidium deliense]
MLLLAVLYLSFCSAFDYKSESDAAKFIDQLNEETVKYYSDDVTAEWNWATNTTDHNRNLSVNLICNFVAAIFCSCNKVQSRLKYYAFQKEKWKTVILFDFKNFKDPLLRRQFEKYSVLGEAALDKKAQQKFTEIVTEMEAIYSSAKISVGNKQNLSLEPDIVGIFKTERNYDTLKEVWLKWRQESGKQIGKYYGTYVQLGNEIAKKNSVAGLKFKDYGEYWLYPYDSLNIKDDVDRIWKQVEPYYKVLHAFVRMQLTKKYGAHVMPKDGTIPAHLLGDVWAQSWTNIFPLVNPYVNDTNDIDFEHEVNKKMVESGFNQTKMFKMAEEFFKSLGLGPLPDSFWKHSMISKPKDREVVCHASAVDFRNGLDFRRNYINFKDNAEYVLRVKQCTEVNMEDLKTVHHELGHIYYYMLYKDQPFILRDGANPVTTPEHLKRIGLLNHSHYRVNPSIFNYMLHMALDKIAFLPFGYFVDKWRWRVFSGNITKKEMNRKWWEYRLKYQGISPPVKRSDSDFDPGSKYHVAADSPFMGYFIAHILQFQFHRSLCNLDYDTYKLKPHLCDLSGNEMAGKKLRKVLSQGMSVPWKEQLKQLTNEEMSADALLEYFAPLYSDLKR